jgi:AcrR family transcriptional regulator
MATPSKVGRAKLERAKLERGRGRPRDEAARRRILKAALDLMDESAFVQMTMEAIADRAGASKATVYRWWPNKAALAIEAFREAVAPELPLRDTGSLRKDLTTQMQNFARMLSGRGGRMLRSFLVAARCDPEVAEAFRSIWSDPRRAEAKKMLRQKQINGQLRDDADLDLVLDALYGPLYYRFLVKNEAPSQKYADALAGLVIQGLANTALAD